MLHFFFGFISIFLLSYLMSVSISFFHTDISIVSGVVINSINWVNLMAIRNSIPNGKIWITSGYSLNFIFHSIENCFLPCVIFNLCSIPPVYSCTVSSILFFQLNQIRWRAGVREETHVFYVTQNQELTISFSSSFFVCRCQFCVTFCVLVFFFCRSDLQLNYSLTENNMANLHAPNLHHNLISPEPMIEMYGSMCDSVGSYLSACARVCKCVVDKQILMFKLIGNNNSTCIVPIS